MNILSKEKDHAIKMDYSKNTKSHIRCLCNKLIAEIDNGTLEILCKKCKRVVRLKVENVIHFQDCRPVSHD